MKKLAVVLSALLFIFAFQPGKKVAIYMVGDSTMAFKPDTAISPERGWGQMLPQFFNNDVTIYNHAVNGRSTKSFINEGKWKAVLEQLQPGDYVFVQFGHNDQKYKDSLRYTNPYTGYRRNLVKFVTESRAKSAIPVLFTSIVRRHFNEFGTLTDTHGAYPLVVRMVANEYKVPLVDLQMMSEDLVNSLGREKSKEYYLWTKPGEYPKYPKGKEDNTHFTVKGATAMARLAVEGLQDTDLPLVKYIKK